MDRYAQLTGTPGDQTRSVLNVIESETDPNGINGEWIACGDAGPGWIYEGGTFSELQANELPIINVTMITADAAHAAQTTLKGYFEVTCPAGTTLDVSAELSLGGQVLPLDDSFRIPLRARDGRERVLLGVMAQGVIRFRVPLPASGVWLVTEAAINEGLPPEQHIAFAGLTIYVVEA